MPEAARSCAETLSVLLEWFETNKVTYNEEAIEVVAQQQTRRGSNIVSANGIGIVAKRDLIDEEPLVVIPKSAVISTASSALANIFEDEELGGSLALCITVMYELAQGIESPWYGYLQSLPKRADIPLLWDIDSRKWLAGTDVGKWVERDEQSVREDFKVLQKLVVDYPAVFVSQNGIDWNHFGCFLDVASLVSSRAFMVDEFRGNSMVPFADIFNHLTAGANVHIESEENVCVLCGNEYGCEHMEPLDDSDSDGDDERHGGCESHSDCEGHGQSDADSWADEEEGGETEDEEEEESDGEEIPILIDHSGNPILAAPDKMDIDDTGSAYKEDENDEASLTDEEDLMSGTLDMVVYQTCKAGSEVFNTYGDHGSAYLLHRYGFCDKDNIFDSVVLDTDDVMQAFSVAVSEKRAEDMALLLSQSAGMFEQRHRAQQESSENEGDDSDEDESEDEEIGLEDGVETEAKPPVFSIDAPGHPDLNLATLLVLGLAEDSVFTQIAESPSVLRHFFPIIRRFWAAFQDKLDAGASVSAAMRVANKDKVVKQSTVGMVCRATQLLAEKRLAQLGDNSLLKNKPTDPTLRARWESAKQMRTNEAAVLQQCIKRYKKAASKLL
ncbi:hypothetical protein H4S01_001856 [Coemansia sp. RSA 2610]|nr:hypothetical protein H4S01_001856 [Coemansia sp. RSA 2610]